MLIVENFADALCLIHGEPTDLEVADVHEDGRCGLVGDVRGVSCLTATPRRRVS